MDNSLKQLVFHNGGFVQKAKGFTYIDLLVTAAIIGVIAAIAIPSLLAAKREYDRKFLFGGEFRNLSTPLTPAQIEVLRPFVQTRIAALCLEPGALTPLPPGTLDKTLVQGQLDRVAERERGPSQDCIRIRAIAKKEGF